MLVLVSLTTGEIDQLKYGDKKFNITKIWVVTIDKVQHNNRQLSTNR